MRARTMLFVLALGTAVTAVHAEIKYKEHKVKGKPVQGPIRPPPTPTPKTKYPIWGSLEEIARLADEVRKRKGLLNVAPIGLATPTPTPTATPEGTPAPTVAPETPTPTPTPVPIYTEGTPVPVVIVDTGPLPDITLLRVSPDRNPTPAASITVDNELAARLKQDAVDTDQILYLDTAERFERGVVALMESRWEDGLTDIRAVRTERPRFLAAWVLEIGTLVRLGRRAEVDELVLTFDSIFPEVRGMSFVDRLHQAPAEAPVPKVETVPTPVPTTVSTPVPALTPTPDPSVTATATPVATGIPVPKTGPGK